MHLFSRLFAPLFRLFDRHPWPSAVILGVLTLGAAFEHWDWSTLWLGMLVGTVLMLESEKHAPPPAAEPA